MSDSYPLNNSDPTIFQAELVQPPERTGSVKYVLLGCGGALLILVVMLGLIGWVAYKNFVAESNVEGAIGKPRVIDQSSKRTTTAMRFRVPQGTPLPPEKIQELEQAIAEIMRCGENTEKLREWISIDGFIRHMHQSGEVSNLSFLQKRAIHRQCSKVTHGPTTFTHFRIVDVADSSADLGADEFTVYLYVWDQPVASEQYCFWLVRESNQWKLSDWESVTAGISEATSYAKLVRLQSEPGIAEYYRGLNLLAQAYDAEVAEDKTGCTQKLNMCDALAVHPEFHDYYCYYLGQSWMNIDLVRAKRAFSRIRDNQPTPGKEFGLMMVAEQEREHAKTVEHAERFQELVGYSPNAARSWVRAKVQLDESDEAKQGLQELIQRFPEDDSAVAEVFEIQKDVDEQFVDEVLSSSEKPAELAMRMSYYLRGHQQVPKLRAIQRWLESKADVSGTAEYLKGLGHDCLWEFDETVAAYRAAIAIADDVNRQKFQRALNTVYFSRGEPMVAYLTAANKLDCLNLLLEGNEYDEKELDYEQLTSILNEAESDFPESHIPNYHRGLLFFERKDYEAAKQQFLMAKSKINGDESIGESIDDNLAQVEAMTGDVVRVFKNRPDMADYFPSLAHALAETGEMGRLGVLIEIHRVAKPDDYLLNFYDSLDWAHQGRYQPVIDIVESPTPSVAETETDWQKSVAKGTAISWLVEQNHWRACLAAPGRKPAMFKALISELDRRGRTVDVNELLARHVELDYPLEDRFGVLAKQLIANQNDSELIRVCTLISPSGWEQVSEYEANPIYLSWLRACVRADDLEEADRIAELLQTNHDNAYGKLLLSVVRGEVDQAAELIPQLMEDRWSWEKLIWFDEMQPWREDPAFHELQKKLAPWLPDKLGQYSTTILTTTPVKLTLEQIQEALASIGQAGVEATQLDSADLKFDGGIFLFYLGNRKGVISSPTSSSFPRNQPDVSKDAQQVIAAANGEFVVTLFDSEHRADSARFVYDLAAALCLENASCVLEYPRMRLLCVKDEKQFQTLPGFDEFEARAKIENLVLEMDLNRPGD